MSTLRLFCKPYSAGGSGDAMNALRPLLHGHFGTLSPAHNIMVNISAIIRSPACKNRFNPLFLATGAPKKGEFLKKQRSWPESNRLRGFAGRCVTLRPRAVRKALTGQSGRRQFYSGRSPIAGNWK